MHLVTFTRRVPINVGNGPAITAEELSAIRKTVAAYQAIFGTH